MSQQHHPINCQQCRKSHIKCDKVLPQCGNCVKSGRTCVFPAPKRNRSSSTSPTATSPSSTAVVVPQQSNKRQRIEPAETMSKEITVFLSPQEIVHHYLNELDDYWTFIPKSLLNQVMSSGSGNSLRYEQLSVQHPVIDAIDYEERVNSVLWDSIVLLTVHHMPIHGHNEVSAGDIRHRIRSITEYLERKCESNLLQVDIHRNMTNDYRLAFAASFLSCYLHTFEEKVGRSRIWMQTTKASLDTLELTQPSNGAEKNNMILMLKLQYLCLKYLSVTNKFDISRPYNCKELYKILKLILKLYATYLFIIEPSNILEDNFDDLMTIFEEGSTKKSVTIENLRKLVKLLSNLVISYESGVSFYRCCESMKAVTILSQNICTYGVFLELFKHEEARYKNSNDQIILQEIYGMQLYMADRISSDLLAYSEAFIQYGIMQLRPLLFAAHVHIQASLRIRTNNTEAINAIQHYLVTDRWLLELLQTKYQLPSSAISILQQLRDQISSTELQVSLIRPVVINNYQPIHQVVTVQPTFVDPQNTDIDVLSPAFLSSIDISALLGLSKEF
jgi:hypothetical protein